MNIGQHIAEILEDQGKVSVPGVGTFYLKKTDAHFDDERQMFFPSDRILSFKLYEEERSNFAEYISKAEDLSSVAAKHIIKEFAIKFNNSLGTSGTAEIRGIGKLKKEGSDYVIETFTSYGLLPLPDSGSIYFEMPDVSKFREKDAPVKESFIDDNIEIPEPLAPEPIIPEPVIPEPIIPKEVPPPIEEPVKEEVPIREEIPVKEEDPLKEQAASPKESYVKDHLSEKEKVVDTDYDSFFSNPGSSERGTRNSEDSSGKTSTLWKWVIISCAVLLVAGSVMAYLFYPKIKVIIQQYRSGAVEAAPPPVVAKTIVPSATDSIADSILTKQTDSIVAAAGASPKIAKPDSAKSGTITYEIIVASFSLKSEAETYVNQWVNKGVKVHIVERPLRTFKYKISAGTFTDQAAAQKELQLVQKNINKEAWIDQIKN